MPIGRSDQAAYASEPPRTATRTSPGPPGGIGKTSGNAVVTTATASTTTVACFSPYQSGSYMFGIGPRLREGTAGRAGDQ
ncbi:hypothetical protein SSPS47_03135 [Streptomyces sp. S4.7]|nr:hypothetical protein SSPS47_03135 [Streptomyces sp. S4.7]